jgi:Flp pilus assembly protein TadB
MSEQRLSRPIYEALPWFYIICGLAALVASYLTRSHAMSFVLGLPGLVAMIGGLVVLLRRREFRRMRADYQNTNSSVLPKGEE